MALPQNLWVYWGRLWGHAQYKQLMDVERSFRHLKDVLAMRPIYHQSATRVGAHIFVAALALLLQRMLDQRLKDSGADLSAPQAMQAAAAINHVTFKVGTQHRHGISTATPRARQVLKALAIPDLKPPAPPQGDQTVM